jgi:thiamine-monophosphate kinase
VDEFELIRRYFQRNGADASVLLGIGDDGAVVSPSSDRELVIVVDTLVAGVHYPEAYPAADTGWRAVVVNASDLAAMGARPRWMTLALTLPEADEAWLTGFAEGLFEAAREYGLTLIGGDTTKGSQTVVSVQLVGEVEAGRVLTRAGASAGEGVYVTGTPGDAAGGLTLLGGSRQAPGQDDANYLVRRFTRPHARTGFGMAIAGVATAAIDLSDGLAGDLVKLLEASGIGATIELERLPLSPQLRRVHGHERALELALDGGDDYELCFTARPDDEEAILEAAAEQALAVTRIGETAAGAGLTCVREGVAVPYRGSGYSHFS